MDLWIVSPDPSVPLALVKKLSNAQMQDARAGKLFLARASSPVFAKFLAEGLRSMAGRLHGMALEDLEKENLWRRSVLMGRAGDVPVYEARLSWPT